MSRADEEILLHPLTGKPFRPGEWELTPLAQRSQEFADKIAHRTEIAAKRLEWSLENHEDEYRKALDRLEALRAKIPHWQYRIFLREIEDKYYPDPD
jgi:hypothetical protein